MPIKFSKATTAAAIAALGCAVASSALFASSHREAPFITEMPKVDGTDFYMFRSYEGVNADGSGGQSDNVTLIANYLPLQDSYGGPNYFTMDPDARYEIHIDQDGDSVEDLTFRFTFENTYRNATVPVGDQNVTIPLANVGPSGNAADVGPGINANDGLNVVENYRLSIIRGDRKSAATAVTNLGNAAGQSPSSSDNSLFRKPVDNIGENTISNYPAYANNHIFNIDVPGCDANGRVFVGQRQEGFVVNLGEVFDRINLNPLDQSRNFAANIVADKNITSLALELPRSCLTNGTEPVIGAWTTASLPQAKIFRPNPTVNQPEVAGGAFTQVSRLGSPLVNEVVIGLDRKDAFNASEPVDDLSNFATFVTNPTLPVLVNALFDVPAPALPRLDLVAAFVTGIRTNVGGTDTNFTQPQSITDANSESLTTGGEMLRLNTAFPATVAGVDSQSDLGFLACDLNGFPNGRRPIDDVVDIELTVLEGALLRDADGNVVNGVQTCDVTPESGPEVIPGAIVNDGALPDADDYLGSFPYLNNPLPGSPVAQSVPQ